MDVTRTEKIKKKGFDIDMEIKIKIMDQSDLLELKKENKMVKRKSQHKWIITDSTEEIVWSGDGVDMLDAISNYFEETYKEKDSIVDFITAWEKLLLGGYNIKRIKLN
jgi:hypothetical protein